MSLRRLALRNFVLVRALEVEFGDGFTVLTGETGAGKSILIDALALALGERADSAVVREGESRADITASFEWPKHLGDMLADAGIEATDELMLRRVVERAGGSRSWINGVPCTAQQLRTIGSALVALHGQHAWQALTRPGLMRAVLDALAGVDRSALATAWYAWREASNARTAAVAAAQARADELDRLQWQIAEVTKLDPGLTEWEPLNDEHRRLAHAAEVIDGLRSAVALLEGTDDDAVGALGALSRAHSHIVALTRHDDRLAGLAQAAAESLSRLQDLARDLHAALGRAEPDPGRLEQLDQRIGAWVSLARRFRLAPQDVPLSLQKWKQESENLRSLMDIQVLESQEKAAREAFLRHAREASRQRTAAARDLGASVTAALPQLGMPGGRLEVALQPLEAPAAHGLEDVDFLIASHAGAVSRPIARTASGGELSRVALAIAVSSSAQGSAQTLIFDEVDAGIGGSTATSVGRLLRQLGQGRQVLAVTHMAQVAACANGHLRVSKSAPDGQSAAVPESHVHVLDVSEREAEIARMLGGVAPGAATAPSPASRAHAREMLHDGNRDVHATRLTGPRTP